MWLVTARLLWNNYLSWCHCEFSILPYQTEIEGTSRAAVIIKAAPNIGRKHGETVCVAGIDFDGNWHRLYPVPFKDLKSGQKFKRWDVIEFSWVRPKDDDRVESKRIFSQTLKVVGEIAKGERHAFARRALVSNFESLKNDGKSFALIRPENPRFSIIKQSEIDLKKKSTLRAFVHRQLDMFGQTIMEKEPPPFRFHYSFEFSGKHREYDCIDWETETTFYKWRSSYGEQEALKLMKLRFGEEYPEKGVAFAMGTHRIKFYNNWLLSGILRVDHDNQMSLL